MMCIGSQEVVPSSKFTDSLVRNGDILIADVMAHLSYQLVSP